MIKQQKSAEIAALKELFEANSFFYIADASALTVGQVNNFRRKCFEEGIHMRVCKNTLIQKALEQLPAEKNYAGVYPTLKGPSAVLFCETANLPARVIKEFRATSEQPVIKAAYIDGGIYIGDDQLDALVKLKSKNELLGELIGLLQSPMQKVLGQLKSGGNTIAGLVKTLEERGA
jgi:large subunit ribosomal protein L10